MRGAEALIRWNHPLRGVVGPDAFIPTCESTGMINALGDWVFEQAARQQVQWAREGLDLKISINLSPRQFRDPELLNRLARIVTATAAQPARLELELTESMLLGVAPHTHETLDDLRRMGFSISVDDFGTGYSNLAYLNRFPIQVLKVDKTFVQDIEANRPVAELIVSMCRLMQLQIVAEGVETPAQLAWVQAQGIEHVSVAIEQMSKVAQDTAESANQIAHAAEQRHGITPIRLLAPRPQSPPQRP